MKIISIFIILVFCILLVSCAGSKCIKIGGSYQGIQGEVEYCFSQEKTETNGISTVIAEDAEKVLVDTGDLEKLLDKIESFVSKTKSETRQNLGERLRSITKF